MPRRRPGLAATSSAAVVRIAIQSACDSSMCSSCAMAPAMALTRRFNSTLSVETIMPGGRADEQFRARGSQLQRRLVQLHGTGFREHILKADVRSLEKICACQRTEKIVIAELAAEKHLRISGDGTHGLARHGSEQRFDN